MVRCPIVAFEGLYSVLVTELPKLGCGLTSRRYHDGAVLIVSLAAASFIACPGGSSESIVVALEIHGRGGWHSCIGNGEVLLGHSPGVCWVWH